MAIKTIKTKRTVEKTVKTLNKSANLAKRAKSTVIKTKDRAEETQQARENSPNEYASVKVEQAAQRATSAAGRGAVKILKNRNIRNSAQKARENLDRAKSHFAEIKRLSPAERRKAAAEAEKTANAAQDTADKFQEIAETANKTVTETRTTVQDAQQTLTEVRQEGRQTLREVKTKVKTEKARLKEVKISEKRDIKEKSNFERQKAKENRKQEIKGRNDNVEGEPTTEKTVKRPNDTGRADGKGGADRIGGKTDGADLRTDGRIAEPSTDIPSGTEPPTSAQRARDTARRNYKLKRNVGETETPKRTYKQNQNKNPKLRETGENISGNANAKTSKLDRTTASPDTAPKGRADRTTATPERRQWTGPTRKSANVPEAKTQAANATKSEAAPKTETTPNSATSQKKDLPHSGEPRTAGRAATQPTVKSTNSGSNPASRGGRVTNGAEKAASGNHTETRPITKSAPSAKSPAATAHSAKTAKEKTTNTVKSAQKSVKEAKRTVKEAHKTAKTAEKTAKATVREAQRAAKNAERAAKATEKAAKAAAKAAQEAAWAAARTAKAAAQALKLIIQAIIEAVQGIVALIAAGGWVAVLIILIVCIVGLIVGSVFGIFLSGGNNGANGTKTLNAVIAEINDEYNAQIDAIVTASGYDLLDMSGAGVNWREVLAIYAAATTADPTNPLDVATMSDEKANILRSVFWTINEITAVLETTDIEEETLDANGQPTRATETASKVVLRISVTRKTPTEAAAALGLTAEQTILIEELLKPEYASLWTALLYGVSPFNGDGTIVAVALSQVGNVGGEVYWRWYGFSSREEWCGIFVSWCAEQAGLIESGAVPKFSICVDGVNWFKGRGQWQNAVGGYVPAPGDIIFYDWDGNGASDHVGIVERSEGDAVFTVEGNSPDIVKQRQYPLGNSHILGYGLPALQTSLQIVP